MPAPGLLPAPAGRLGCHGLSTAGCAAAGALARAPPADTEPRQRPAARAPGRARRAPADTGAAGLLRLYPLSGSERTTGVRLGPARSEFRGAVPSQPLRRVRPA